MILKRRKSFDKSFFKADKNVVHKTLQTLELFKENPFDSLLHNHALQGMGLVIEE